MTGIKEIRDNGEKQYRFAGYVDTLLQYDPLYLDEDYEVGTNPNIDDVVESTMVLVYRADEHGVNLYDTRTFSEWDNSINMHGLREDWANEFVFEEQRAAFGHHMTDHECREHVMQTIHLEEEGPVIGSFGLDETDPDPEAQRAAWAYRVFIEINRAAWKASK